MNTHPETPEARSARLDREHIERLDRSEQARRKLQESNNELAKRLANDSGRWRCHVVGCCR